MTSGPALHTAFPACEPSRPRGSLGPRSSPGSGRWPSGHCPGLSGSGPHLSGTACPPRAGERVLGCGPGPLRARGRGSLMRPREGGESERRAGTARPRLVTAPPQESMRVYAASVYTTVVRELALRDRSPALHRRGAGVLPAVVGPDGLQDPEAPGDAAWERGPRCPGGETGRRRGRAAEMWCSWLSLPAAAYAPGPLAPHETAAPLPACTEPC